MIAFGAQSITSTWHMYKIQVGGTGACPGFPTLGHNRYNDKYVGAIAVGFNLFACSPRGFGGLVSNQIWFLPRVPIYSNAGFGFNFFYNLTYGGTLLDTL